MGEWRRGRWGGRLSESQIRMKRRLGWGGGVVGGGRGGRNKGVGVGEGGGGCRGGGQVR